MSGRLRTARLLLRSLRAKRLFSTVDNSKGINANKTVDRSPPSDKPADNKTITTSWSAPANQTAAPANPKAASAPTTQATPAGASATAPKPAAAQQASASSVPAAASVVRSADSVPTAVHFSNASTETTSSTGTLVKVGAGLAVVGTLALAGTVSLSLNSPSTRSSVESSFPVMKPIIKYFEPAPKASPSTPQSERVDSTRQKTASSKPASPSPKKDQPPVSTIAIPASDSTTNTAVHGAVSNAPATLASTAAADLSSTAPQGFAAVRDAVPPADSPPASPTVAADVAKSGDLTSPAPLVSPSADAAVPSIEPISALSSETDASGISSPEPLLDSSLVKSSEAPTVALNTSDGVVLVPSQLTLNDDDVEKLELHEIAGKASHPASSVKSIYTEAGEGSSKVVNEPTTAAALDALPASVSPAVAVVSPVLSVEDQLVEAQHRIAQLMEITASQEKELVDLFQSTKVLLADQFDAVTAAANSELLSLQEQFSAQLEKERKFWEDKHVQELQAHFRVQEADHRASLDAALKATAETVKSETEAKVTIRLGRERTAALKTIEQMLLRLKAVEKMLTSHADAEALVRNTHLLFLATQELTNRFGKHQPLRPQVDLLRGISANNGFILSLLNEIPQTALSHGVYSQQELNDGFFDMKRSVRRVLYVGEDGGLWAHAVSYVAALFTLDQVGFPDGADANSILARADHYVKRNDIEAAAREINQLRGAAKSVASDWLKDVRAHLEVQQTLALLNAYISVTGLSFA
eukprot:m.582602 g.582602  ORF g.582602 m.582602 type:complete len:757 (+) comp57945_c0_seq1:13-2283(+)